MSADMSVGRNYQIETAGSFNPRIFVQGYSEETHGLSDTLLSVLAVRVEEIAAQLMEPESKPVQALSAAE